MCRALARLARALEAVHAAGAVHRDVKGDNIVVRLSDRLPVLIDFGSCHFAGAQRMTWQSLPPVTLEYLSPQAMLFYIRLQHHPDGYYPPSPADDLYALGVTAYRLVMGQYPPPMDVRRDEQGAWQMRSPDVRPLLESNPRIEPVLREVLVRLLSDAPEARGTAGQVAEALEAGAGEAEHPEPAKPPVRARAWKPWLALTAAGISAVLLWHTKPVLVRPGPSAQPPEAGTAAVGDTSPTEPQASTAPGTEEKKPPAQESLPEPRPGQLQPDKKGQCPVRQQIPINGGCWIDVNSLADAQSCAGSGYVFFQGKCFGPALEPPRKPQPTSSPPEAR